MKTLLGKGEASGFTLVELLVVAVILFALAAFLLPANRPGGSAPGIQCISNLRQVDMAFIMYADDNHGKYPMVYAATNGGTMEAVSEGQVSPHLQKIASYIPKQLRLLVCPVDPGKTVATNFETLTGRNISYFLNADVTTNRAAASVLAGDRNLEYDRQPVRPGLFLLTTNAYLQWGRDIHKRRGNLAFADGHVQWTEANLNSVLRDQPLATNRLCVP